MWLLENAGVLNLVFSLLVLISGGIIFKFTKPRAFEEHPYLKRTFGFWLLLWFMIIMIWAVYGGSPSRAVLACIDLYTVCVLGFFWSYAEADEFQWSTTIQNLVFLYGFLLLWNLVLGTRALKEPSPSDWRWAWILPSEAVSALALILLALVFLFRYGPVAIPFSCVVVPLYALFQRPTYSAMFLRAVHPGWFLALAAGKLVFGVVFYTLFFSPAREYLPVRIPKIGPHGPEVAKKWLRLAGGTFLGAILTLLATRFTDWIGQLLRR